MTAVSDIITAAQRRADRVNGPWTPADWLEWANGSLQELYGVLTSTYEDYNVKQYAFSLTGGSQANNSLNVGPNTAVPDFFQPRAMWLQISGSPTPFVTIPRLESLAERNLYVFPNIVPIYGAIPSRWNLLGSQIEILPPNVGGAQYVLWYVPTLPVFVDINQPIDSYWLTVNGWQEYAILDAAAKALVREESLDTAQLLLQAKAALQARILKEAMPRDVSGPRAIVDMQRVRSHSPWGPGGPGWGGSGGWGVGDGGCW